MKKFASVCVLALVVCLVFAVSAQAGIFRHHCSECAAPAVCAPACAAPAPCCKVCPDQCKVECCKVCKLRPCRCKACAPACKVCAPVCPAPCAAVKAVPCTPAPAPCAPVKACAPVACVQTCESEHHCGLFARLRAHRCCCR
jgi:hypothetical protein